VAVSFFYWWTKPEDPEETTDLLQVTDKWKDDKILAECDGKCSKMYRQQICGDKNWKWTMCDDNSSYDHWSSI